MAAHCGEEARDVSNQTSDDKRENDVDAETDGGSTDLSEWEDVSTPQFRGEMFQTVFGGLRGVYTWECDHVPSEDEVREGMCVRVVRDCRRLRSRDRCTQLSEWHGGFTPEGVGVFATDIWSTSEERRTRHVGSASVIVRTPSDTGSRTWNGVAC
jgi:hypothetical protein